MTDLNSDTYPNAPATVTAANNLFRCLLGAGASAAIDPMTRVMGHGWAYTLLSLLFVVSSIGPAASMKYGIQWRKARKEKEEARRLRKTEQG